MVFDFIHRKKSVIYSWVLSYILLILIPALFTGIVYFITKNIIEDEINRSNELVLTNIRDNTDNILSDVERFSMELATSQSVQDMLAIHANEESANYAMYKVSRSLYNYKIFNSSLRGFYIYFNNFNMVVTPGVVYEDYIYCDAYLPLKDNSKERWQEMMNKRHNGVYQLMPYLDEVNGAMNTVAYIHSIPVSSLESFSANLVILLDLDEIAMGKDDRQGYSDETNLCIITGKGEVMVGDNGSTMLLGLDYNKLDDEKGNITEVISGKKHILSYTTSRVNGWKYITVTPESVFWVKAQFIRNIVLGGLTFCIFLSGFVSFIYLKKNYNPLKEIVKYFQDKMQSELDSKNNEYGFIKKVLSDALEQKEKVTNMLEQQNKVLKSGFIASLLKGKETILPIHELLTTYNISFKYPYFTAMAIYIEALDEDFWNENGDVIEKYSMAKFVITNVIEELVNRNACGCMTEVDDMLACMVNMNKVGENCMEELLEVIREAKEFFKKYYRMDIIVAIGALHDSFEGVPAAFNEAMQTLEYTRVMGGDTLFFCDIAKDSGPEYYFPVEKEYQLINCVKSGDFPGASNILEEVINRNIVDSKPSLQSVRCFMFDLTSTVLKTMNEIGKTLNGNFFEKLNPSNELLKCTTLAEMKGKMLYIFENVCEYVSKNNQQTDYRIRDMVIEFIEHNISNSNLSITSIAEKIGKNPYYTSRVFKEQTGEGILEYINKFRIEKSKELIREKMWNQEEIASKVGYTNVRTFHRVFKKFEGTSPGKIKS